MRTDPRESAAAPARTGSRRTATDAGSSSGPSLASKTRSHRAPLAAPLGSWALEADGVLGDRVEAIAPAIARARARATAGATAREDAVDHRVVVRAGAPRTGGAGPVRIVTSARVLPPSDEAIDAALVVLRAGGLVGLPTETVYGLAADASDPSAVQRVFRAKERPSDHPLIVHVADAAAMERWTTAVPPVAQALAGAFWPGPLSLVLPRSPAVPDVVTGGRPTVALRVPDQPLTRRLLERFGGGLAAPSANRFGRVSPTRAEHVVEEIGDAVDLVLDGGPCRVGVESTIVEVGADGLVVLRTGTITVDDLERVAGCPVEAQARGPARAPGMLASHYAPAARVVVAGSQPAADVAAALATGARVAVLAETPPPDLPAEAVMLDPVGDPAGYARELYERLRRADALGCDVVVAVPPRAVGPGLAVRDRLFRAAAAGSTRRHDDREPPGGVASFSWRPAHRPVRGAP